MDALRRELAGLKARLGAARHETAAVLTKYSFADGEDAVKIYISIEQASLRTRRTNEEGDARRCCDAGVSARAHLAGSDRTLLH